MDLTVVLGTISSVFGIIIIVVSIFAVKYKGIIKAIQDLVVEAVSDYFPDKKLSQEEVARLQVKLFFLVNEIKKVTGK